MNQPQNKIIIWSIELLERGVKINVRPQSDQCSISFSFTSSGRLLNKELKKDVENELKRLYHPDHDFKLTLKKLLKNFHKGQKTEWQDYCNGKDCHYIYLRDPIIATIQTLIKIKDFICKIRL